MVKTALSLTFTPLNTVICGFLYFLVFFFIFRTMPKIHINGRSSNSSLELDELGTSYVTGSSLLVPAESYNLSIAISTTTNTMDTGNSFCGYLFLLCFGNYDCNRNLARQKKKDNENSRKRWIQREPSSSSNSLKKWTKHVNDYYNILTQCN